MIDYNYYITIYDGKKITSGEKFESLSKIARKYIDSVTCKPAQDKEIGEGLCAICDILYEHADCIGLTSQTIDGIRQDFENNRIQKLMYNTLKLYIPSRLLYRGI